MLNNLTNGEQISYLLAYLWILGWFSFLYILYLLEVQLEQKYGYYTKGPRKGQLRDKPIKKNNKNKKYKLIMKKGLTKEPKYELVTKEGVIEIV